MTAKNPAARRKAPSGAPLRFVAAATMYEGAECVLWPFGSSRDGYGKLWHDGQPVGAHVLALSAWDGPKPPGRECCHKCGNRACINPLHLYWGTRQDNVNDKMLALGRVRGWRPAWVNP